MPFQLRVSRVEYSRKEMSIAGTLVAGAYAGPECVTLWGMDGASFEAPVASHGMIYPEGWPVLPSHESTELTLHVPLPSRGFRLDESKLVVGHGSLLMNPNREDITDLLGDPLFWASFLGFHASSDEVEEPNEEFWGISSKDTNRFYEKTFERRYRSGIWPFAKLQVDDQRHLEIEFSAGIEYQDRFWAVDSKTGTRALLGYHSGHFSLPCFRLEELLALHARSPALGRALFLPLTACYLSFSTRWPKELMSQLAENLPGIRKGKASVLAHVFSTRLLVDDVHWKKHPRLGWVNDSRYSQRNPKSTMSVLAPQDFELIATFFES